MFECIAIFICLFFNALLSGSETAFIAVNKTALRSLIKKGNEKVKLLLELRENPERTLSIIQVGITFLGAFAAAIGGAGAEENISPWLIEKFGFDDTVAEMISILIVVVPLTYASVVFGELVPKTLALRRSLSFATAAAPWLYFASRVISPVVTLLENSTKKTISLFPKEQTTSEEVETISDHLEEALSPMNKQYIMNMVKLERTIVKEIFVEWKNVVYAQETQTLEEVEKIIIASGHTRLPILKEEQVIGILNSKEFLALQKTGRLDWISLCRPVVNVSESTLILTALRLLQEKRAHMAIVYSGVQKAGIVTMESIFEEIIGDIYDEDDDGLIKKILTSVKYSPEKRISISN